MKNQERNVLKVYQNKLQKKRVNYNKIYKRENITYKKQKNEKKHLSEQNMNLYTF